MAKRLSDKEKERLTQEFINGKNLNDLVEEFNSTKLTISRYLKKNLGEKTYQSILKKSKTPKGLLINQKISSLIDNQELQNNKVFKKNITHKEADNSNFIEEESSSSLN